MAGWHLHLEDGGWRVEGPTGVTVATGDDQGVRFAFVGAETGEISELQSTVVHTNRLNLVSTSTPEAAPEGEITVYYDPTDRQIKMIDDAGNIGPLTMRVGVATLPAPPESAR